LLMVQICVGSSCFLRGAPEVIKQLQELLAAHEVTERVVLKGSFCMELCTKGVTVRVGDKVISGVTPQDVPDLFATEILSALKE